MLATSAVRLLLICAVLSTPLRTASAAEIACSVNITGISTFPEDLRYSSGFVECSSRTQEPVQLPLLIHNSLEPHKETINGTGMLSEADYTLFPAYFHHFAGVVAQFSDTVSALLTVNASVDLTFRSSQLKDINAWNLTSLISIQAGNSNVLFDQLSSTRCNTSWSLLSVQPAAPSNNNITARNTIFNKSEQTAVFIANSSSASINSISIDGSYTPAVLTSGVEKTSISDSNFTDLAGPEDPDQPLRYSGVQILSSSTATVTLEACRFANISGRALDLNYGRATVEKCTFSNNTGGAIGDSATRSTYISNSTFHNNTNCKVQGSVGWGGAVYSTSRDLVIDTCDFLGNIAADGGAVFAEESRATIRNSSFRDNAASPTQLQRRTGGPPFSDTQDGGAIYILGNSSAGNLQRLYVFNCTFLRNFAWGSARAIRSWQLPGNVYINQSSFAHNQGLSLAADLYGFGSNERVTNLVVRGSNFTNSRSSTSIGANSLRCFGIQGSNFSNSMHQGVRADNIGGQCEESNYHVLSVDVFDRASISADSTAARGIGDFIGHDISFSISIDIRHCNFNNLSSQAVSIKGGLNSRVVVAQTTFVGGSSGVALQTTACSNVVIWGSLFSNNVNFGNGGAIASDLNLGAGMLIGESVFINNTAIQGGAIWGSAGARFNITSNRRFLGNKANGTGGAIQCNGCRMALWGGTLLQQNHAQQGGGALACSQCGRAQFDHAYIPSNRSALVLAPSPASQLGKLHAAWCHAFRLDACIQVRCITVSCIQAQCVMVSCIHAQCATVPCIHVQFTTVSCIQFNAP